MNDEKKVFNHLNEIIDFNLDYSSLSNRIDFDKYSSLLKRNKIKKIISNCCLTFACLLLFTIIAFPFLFIFNFKISTSFKRFNQRYSQSEIALIENNSFKKLNNIIYPNTTDIKPVDLEYQQAIYNFAYSIYKEISSTDNLIFSPLSLYSNLDIVSLGSQNEDVLREFDQVLGLTRYSREKNYKNMYKSNYYYNDDGTCQMYNSVFLSNTYDYNSSFIQILDDYYTEAYQLNFNNQDDVREMVKWVNQSVQDNNFLNINDINLKDETLVYFFSTLYFKNKWANKYSSNKNTTDSFYLSNNEKINDVTYLNHKYFGTVYDYGTYLSVYDYYRNGQKIQYLVPKELDNDIFSLIDGNNFLVEDETKKVQSKNNRKDIIVDLSLPKFNTSSFIDFKSSLSNLGLSSIFNSNIDSLNKIFNNTDNPVYVDEIIQKNSISFNEEGTEAKTITISVGATSAAPFDGDTYKIQLNQPFIYVIRDKNDLPLYIGNVNTI